MAYSYNTVVVDGTSDTVLVPFPFLLRGHVSITHNGVVVPSSEYDWDSDGEITLNALPAPGTLQTVRRTTPRDEPAVVYTAGNLSSKNLNISELQNLYIDQEIGDLFDEFKRDTESRALRVEDGPVGLIPKAELRIRRLLSFDDAGDPLMILPGTVVTSGEATFPSAVMAGGASLPVLQSYFTTAGFYNPGDGGHGTYRVVGSEPSHAAKIPLAGGLWGELAEGPINIRQVGARLDNVSDDTQAWRDAAGTGRPIIFPRGWSYVTGQIDLQPAQEIDGQGGRTGSVIRVDAAFNMSALGVLRFLSGEPGPSIQDIGIKFDQPDSATRADLITYPPAIFAVEKPRFKITRCRISGATVGIDMKGNSGGATVTDLEMSAFGVGIDIDGALDSVKLHMLHFWPFDLTANQKVIFKDGVGRAIKSGRCDDFKLTDSILFGMPNAAEFYAGTRPGLAGTTIGSIMGCDFDDQGGLKVTDASLAVLGCLFTLSNASGYWVTALNGRVNLLGCHFLSTVALSGPGIDLGGGTNLFATIGNGTYSTAQHDFEHIRIGANVRYNVADNVYNKAGGITYSTPGIINVAVITGSRGVINSNVITEMGAGTGTFINFAGDAAAGCSENQCSNWGIGLPSGFSVICVGRNYRAANAGLSQGHYVNHFNTKKVVGALSAGSATVTHGIPSLNTKVVHIDAYYVSGTDRIPLTKGTLTSTTLDISGGSGSASYEVIITYMP